MRIYTPDDIENMRFIYDRDKPLLHESSIIIKKNLKIVEDINFDNCDLSGLRLIGVEFRNCSFINADFHDTKILLCNLSNSSLKGAYLRLAHFQDVDLSNADLSNTKIRGARLRDVNLEGTNFEGADLDIKTIKHECKMEDFYCELLVTYTEMQLTYYDNHNKYASFSEIRKLLEQTDRNLII